MPTYDHHFKATFNQLHGVDFVDFDTVKLKVKAQESMTHYTELCNGIVELIRTAGDYSETDFNNRWDDLIETAQNKLKTTFDSEPTFQAMPEKLSQYWQILYVIDDAALMSFGLFRWRENFLAMVKFEKDLKEKIVELTAKWRALLGETEAVASPQKAAVDFMIKSLDNSIKSVALFKEDVDGLLASFGTAMTDMEKNKPTIRQWWGKQGTELFDSVKGLIAAFIGPGGRVAAEVLGNFAQNKLKKKIADAQESRAAYLAAVKEYREKMVRQGAILSMFQSNRDAVEKYRTENNIETLKSGLNESNTILDKWIESSSSIRISTPDCGENTKLVVAEIRRLQQAMFEKCEAADLAFRTDFVGLFEGTLKPETIEKLVNEMQIKAYADMQANGLDVRRLDEPLLLQGTIESEVEEMAKGLTEPEGFTDELKVIWLSDKNEFVAIVMNHLQSLTRDYLNQFMKEVAELKEAARQLSENVDRQDLKNQLS
jgi:hypothetical protein